MSDVESIESDSIHTAKSNDEEYRYRPYEDDDEPPQIKAKDPLDNIAIGFSKSFAPTSVPSHVLNESYSQLYESDEYEDEEFENEVDNYSDTFEVEASLAKLTTDKLHSVNPSQTAMSRIQLSNTEPKTYQALQVELALEEISKEVLRLRTSLKLQLQQRRQAIKEKQDRAHKRRLKHQEELIELKTQISVLSDDKSNLERELQLRQQRIDAIEIQRESLKQQNDEFSSQISSLTETISQLLQDRDETKRSMLTERNEMNRLKEALNKENERLQTEMTKCQLLIDITKTSMETQEARLQRDRENLPKYHARMIEEKMHHIHKLEEALRQRESAIRSEELQRTAFVEELRKTALDDIASYRQSIDHDILRERQLVSDARQALETEKQRLLNINVRDRQQIEADQLKIRFEREHLQDDKLKLETLRHDLQCDKNNIEPFLTTARLQRDEAETLQRQARDTLREAEEKINRVIEKERELIAKERFYREQLSRFSMQQSRVADENRMLANKRAQLSSHQTELQSLQHRLHQQSLALSELSHQLQQILFQTDFPVSERVADEFPSRQPGRGDDERSQEEKKGTSDIHRRINEYLRSYYSQHSLHRQVFTKTLGMTRSSQLKSSRGFDPSSTRLFYADELSRISTLAAAAGEDIARVRFEDLPKFSLETEDEKVVDDAEYVSDKVIDSSAYTQMDETLSSKVTGIDNQPELRLAIRNRESDEGQLIATIGHFDTTIKASIVESEEKANQLRALAAKYQ